jgi:hypothetical protein
MNLLNWLRSLRRAEPASAATIRHELQALRHQQAVTVQQRDLLAHDAVNDETAAARWGHLDKSAHNLDQRIQVLTAALPTAEAKEAETARQAEAAALAKRIEDYEKATAEARGFVDTILARLVTGEELTVAREFGRVLASEARLLHPLTGTAQHRRPIDPMYEIRAALVHRIERIDRARWAPQAPITLKEKAS